MLKGDEQLSELQNYLGDIYSIANNELSIEAILCRMLEAVSETTSPFDTVENSTTFVKALSWYFAFCNRVSIDVQACVVRRYPHVCPSCISEICVCERTERLPVRASYLAGSKHDELYARAESLLNKRKISQEKLEPIDLDWFSRTLSGIYPVNRARWRVNRYYFPTKLLRETGKLANGFRKYRNAGASKNEEGAKKLLENDAADFFAWAVANWSLSSSELNDYDLQGKFVQRYQSGCPYCHQVPCGCPREKRLGNRAEFVSFNLLNSSTELVQELEKRLQDVKTSLEPYPELAKEYEVELQPGAALRADPRKILSRIMESTQKLDTSTGNVDNILRRISHVYELIERAISFFSKLKCETSWLAISSLAR